MRLKNVLKNRRAQATVEYILLTLAMVAILGVFGNVVRKDYAYYQTYEYVDNHEQFIVWTTGTDVYNSVAPEDLKVNSLFDKVVDSAIARFTTTD